MLVRLLGTGPAQPGRGGMIGRRAAATAYLGGTNAFAMLRLLPMSNRDKDLEVLALRHQVVVLPLHRLPRDVLRGQARQGHYRRQRTKYNDRPL
jgi:hypothetical protein